TYGTARGDVAADSGNPDWSFSGYSVVWVVSGVQPGPHTLYVYAHSLAADDWSYTTVPISVSGSGASTAPGASSAGVVVKVEAPGAGATVAGTTTIRGVAADCATGQAPSRITVFN